MRSALKKMSKLKGRSAEEIRARLTQALAARGEAYGLSRQARLPGEAELLRSLVAVEFWKEQEVSADTLLANFRNRTEPKFFAGFDDSNAMRLELQQLRDSQTEQLLLERAGRITEGNFDLLGAHNLDFGKDVDWHLEPVSGKRTPLEHWSQVDYLDPDVAGDKKFIWELNRHQYFCTLGRAYWLAGDELYAETFARHIESWMNGNPPKLGINWASSLEIAFRAISWLYALCFFRNSPHLTAPLFSRILRYLYLHARHLETYLSTYFSPNTHLTGEALGLFYLGTLLPQFRRAKRWRSTGKRILLAALDRHVYSDGVYFEQSSYYHRYTADFYTHFLILARRNDEHLPGQVIEEKLTALLDHLMYISRPDGTTPLFGDDDGGRLVMLGESAPDDFRSTLSTGALLFHRTDYKYVAGKLAEETLWLIGSEAARSFDDLAAETPAHTSRAFPDGGYYVMRGGWSDTSDYLLLDCGAHGSLNCGHAHADALSFNLAANGRTLLVDPGTYTYTGSKKMRDLFRSSAAHNTLVIDGESSSVPDDAFTWRTVAQSTVSAWHSCERFDFFKGAHDGYRRLPAPADHSRSILFLKNDYWIARDEVTTAGAHRYDLNLHFPPNVTPLIAAGNPSDAKRIPHISANAPEENSAGLDVFACSNDGEWRIGSGLVSRCYGESSAAPVAVFSSSAKGAYELITFLIPRLKDAAQVRVKEVEAEGGRAFEVRHDDDGKSFDVVCFREHDAIETRQFSSDFAWIWARFHQPRAHIPCELILIDGHRFAFDGQEMFASAARVSYAALRFIDNEVRLEIDAACVDFQVTAPRAAKRAIINGKTYATNGEKFLHFVNGELRAGATLEPAEMFI